MAINVIVTDAGFSALLNAEASGTEKVKLTKIGFGSESYVPSQEQTELKNQFKIFDSEFGGEKDGNSIQISLRDASEDAYDVYEFGIYTDAGILFAVYSQETPILSKTEATVAMLYFEFFLKNGNPEYIELDPLIFDLNSATENREGIAEIATEAEAKAGTDDTRFITPKKLDAVIEGHDSIVHRSGAETISGSKTFTKDITVNAPATSAPTGVKINDTNGKGTGYLAQYYAGNEYYTRVMCKNNTSGKSAHIDVKINDDGTSMFSPSVDVMCAPSVSESDKSAKVATTEWVSNKVAKYLPLTGGTISGTIFTSGSGSPVLSVKKGDLNGGRIFLFAPDDADFLGGIVLRAYNSDNTRFVDLTIKSDNTMTWGGKNIVRSVNNTAADAAGNVSITSVSGNAGTATKLQTARTITLTGDVTGSTSFDGSGNVSITVTVADDSHNHVISNIDGLQSALDGKLPLAGGKMTSTTAISRNVANSFLGLHGGTGTNNDGAQLFLCGASHSTMPGAFQLTARDSSKAMTLQGNLDGTLNWGDKYVLNNSFLMPTDGGAIHLTAGISATGGAYFRLYGKDNTSGAGQFVLATTNGTNTNALIGKPDGSLTWMGKSLLNDEKGVGYPDYSAGVDITTAYEEADTYTFTEDGWVYPRANASAKMYINGGLVVASSDASQHANIIPVKAGDVLTGGGVKLVIFYPMR